MIPSMRRAKRPRPLGDLPRNWADLGDGPAGLIAELALANDVADYVRFRAVCRPWRRCSPDPCAGGLNYRFLPRRWIMIDKAVAGPRRHRFLNVSTGERIHMDILEFAQHKLLALTPEGLLLLLHEPTLAARLLNPLTRQLTDLPPATALFTPEQHRHRALGFKTELDVTGVGLFVAAATADASTVSVAISFCRPRVIAVAKPGDESWTVVEYDEHMDSALPFAGRFYCATWKGVMVLDMGSDEQPPRLQMVADRREAFFFVHMSESLHLVDNGGELMLVHRRMRRNHYVEFHRQYDAYKVDLEAGALVRAKGFNGRAVFIGMHRAISVSAQATFLSVKADTVYKCGVRTEAYNIADGSRCGRITDAEVNFLAHCIQGVGKQLA
ncbi:uncharacterized protein LOC123398783 [Hordeum vulgare subsp. vulgare]|uniref:KIB1-4 beta-propeller domain-containing protein n=1 Tax=Hordeum vulgare subsp. vulgare TaxID=112509 RepID=A0A8I6YKS0_HORVV|nr:uncharacterized protein LOC123398783 [Hordeum vulgare subsp. vulgare]